MKKTIKSLSSTQHIHPAVGIAYKILFTDGSSSLVYEETFFYQHEEYKNNYLNDEWMVGKELDLEEGFFELVF